MLYQMLAIENRKLTRRTMLWVEWGVLFLILLAFFGLIFGTRLALTSGIDTSGENGGLIITGIDEPMATDLLTWPLGLQPAFTIVTGFGGFLLVILTGALIAQEYNWRSLQLWLTRGVPRPVLLLAKFVTVTLTALAMTVTMVLLGGAVSAVFSQFLLGSIPVAAINWGLLLLHILLTVYGLLPLLALTLLLAVISRSAVVAIGGGLAYTALIEPLAMQLLPLLGARGARLAEFMPASLAAVLRTISAGFTGATANPPAGDITPAAAALLLALITAALLGAALAIFQRQDLGG